MEKRDKRNLILTVLICLLPIILGGVLYNKLPDQMAIHFTINDIPDNYANKNFALFVIPIILATVQAVTLLATTKLRKMENDKKPKVLKIFEWFIPILTVLIYIIMIQFSLGKTIYIGKSVCLILGIIFMIIGNYMPKMSYEVGKTLMHPAPKNEKSFRKITKTFGYSFMTCGIILLILVIFV